MKIAIATDHRGVDLKSFLLNKIEEMGFEFLDFGTNDDQASVDYPDYAKQVVDVVANKEADYGILICGSGIGMSIAANRNPNIRAALCYKEKEAEMTRRHNNANVLVFSSDSIDNETATNCLSAFLNTPFDGGRHERRVEKLSCIYNINK